MKFSILPMMLLLASCGDTLPGSGSINRVGETRSLLNTSVAVSGLDRQNIISLCSALSQKESILPTTVNSTHIFSISQTDCGGRLTETGDVGVTIQNVGGYVFRRNDNLSFIFPEVETATTGILKEVCASVTLPNLANPLRTTSDVLYFGTLGIGPVDCPPRSGELCILLERGLVQGTSAVIHTQDWIRIKVNPLEEKLGFFSYRKRITKSFCAPNQTQTFTATLK